jgi:hypothetical protein
MKNNFNYSEDEKHCCTKLNIDIEGMRGLWSEVTDKQRMEIIKSVIWCAPDMQTFYRKVLKELDPKKFEITLD